MFDLEKHSCSDPLSVFPLVFHRYRRDTVKSHLTVMFSLSILVQLSLPLSLLSVVTVFIAAAAARLTVFFFFM